jgi:hypothetical protein
MSVSCAKQYRNQEASPPIDTTSSHALSCFSNRRNLCKTSRISSCEAESSRLHQIHSHVFANSQSNGVILHLTDTVSQLLLDIFSRRRASILHCSSGGCTSRKFYSFWGSVWRCSYVTNSQKTLHACSMPWDQDRDHVTFTCEQPLNIFSKKDSFCETCLSFKL